jgi:hypothetical protein
VELAALQALHFRHFLPEMKRRIERLCLFEQAVDQLLSTANRQRRDVVNRLVGIQLGALSAGAGQRIDDMGADAKQAEFENLEQAHGARTDDDGIDRQAAGGR